LDLSALVSDVSGRILKYCVARVGGCRVPGRRKQDHRALEPLVVRRKRIRPVGRPDRQVLKSRRSLRHLRNRRPRKVRHNRIEIAIPDGQVHRQNAKASTRKPPPNAPIPLRQILVPPPCSTCGPSHCEVDIHEKVPSTTMSFTCCNRHSSLMPSQTRSIASVSSRRTSQKR
jgi:hypothetical protein